jgi:hypothetical protein
MPTPQDFYVRVGAAPPPLVRQSIAPRVELTDSVTIYASGAALTQVGYVIRDVLNPNTRVDSGAVTASSSSFGPKGVTFNLDTKWQGKRVSISAFARDSAGNVGWAVPAGVNTPITDTTKMARDTTLIVYGRTYALPAGRNGVASDISVDGSNGNVFISNTQYNRLERWAGSTKAFDASGVAVGSQPWGMAIQNDGDTLLVANSGGTNISKVCINPAVCGGVAEVLSARLQTRSTYVFTVTESRDATTGKIRLTLAGPFTYSDRPQYVQQSAGGRVFYSTRPTSTAPAGTIRWLDPTKRVPDPRQIWQYATPSGDATKYAIFNSDSILIIAAPANSNKSDQMVIFDHVYGDTVGGSCFGVPNVICGQDSVVVDARDKVRAQGGDVETVNNLDVDSLNLPVTPVVAAIGDRSWIGFGEGNTGGGTGRIMMVNDPGGPSPGYFSPNVTVRDILNNASESVYGLGLDLHGANVVVHGQESYFAALETPFHLRLQGTYDSFSTGAGVTFHPSADLRNGYFTSSSTDSTRTAFVASSNGSIEVVDAKYFVTRGSLVIKNNLYGALRASLPFPTDNQGLLPSDPNYIVLKLFGLTPKGLVVINLRASDIQPVP